MRIYYCICFKYLCRSKDLPCVWPEKDPTISKPINVVKLKQLCLCILSSENIKQLWRHHVISAWF